MFIVDVATQTIILFTSPGFPALAWRWREFMLHGGPYATQILPFNRYDFDMSNGGIFFGKP